MKIFVYRGENLLKTEKIEDLRQELKKYLNKEGITSITVLYGETKVFNWRIEDISLKNVVEMLDIL